MARKNKSADMLTGKRKNPFPSVFHRLFLAASLFLAPFPLAAARYYPFMDTSVYLGQHVFEGDASGFAGNFSLTYVPAVKFSEKFGLLPSYRTSYEATRSVVDLAGGGQLFQASMSHDLLVKGLWSPSPKWRLKPSVGLGAEFLRETKDEKLFDGLFDYYKPSAGLEIEWIQNPREQLAVSVNYYHILFPNYSSLESSVSSGLGRAQQGENVLDSQNLAGEASYTLPFVFPDLRLTLSYGQTLTGYGEQKVVAASGDLTAEERSDRYQSYVASLMYPARLGAGLRCLFGLDARESRRGSNQNFYDARRTQFLENFYDYRERTYRPRLDFLMGDRGGSLALGFLWVERSYDNRPIQNAEGRYLAEALTLTEKAFTVDIKIPVAARLYLRAKSAFSQSDSNTDYEKIFRTKYQFSNHLIGLQYEL